MSFQANSSKAHEHDPGRDSRIFVGKILAGFYLEVVNLLLSTEFESFALNSSLKLFLPLHDPSVFQSHWAELSTKPEGNRIAFLLLVSTDSVKAILIGFDVEWINYLSDFVDNFLRWPVNHDLLANLLSQSLFNRSNCSREETHLLEFSIIEPLGKIFIGILLGVVRQNDEFVNGNVELLQGI